MSRRYGTRAMWGAIQRSVQLFHVFEGRAEGDELYTEFQVRLRISAGWHLHL